MAGEPTVWLGLAGEMVDPSEALDYHVTKCGGAPLYPGRRPPLRAADMCCRVCGALLSLVLQAFSPAEGCQTRCLLVFGCTADQCGRKPGSWRAWRCQLSQPPAALEAPPGGGAVPEEAAAGQGKLADGARAAGGSGGGSIPGFDGSSGSGGVGGGGVPGFDGGAAADDWGLGGGGTFGGGVGGGGAFNLYGAFGGGGGGGAFDLAAGGGSGGAFDFSDLASAVEKAGADMSAAAQARQKAAAAAPKPAPAAAAAAVKGCAGEAGPRLPEFHVYSEVEPAGAAIPEREMQHVRQLLASYQAAAAPGDDPTAAAPAPAPAPPPAGRPGKGGKGGGGGGDEDGGPEAWAGEGYEPTTLRGVVRSYVKFSKRVERQPLQVARYCPGGPPLWPAAPPPVAAPCAACGGLCAFELQLMPALIQMLVEAADMERGAAPEGGRADADKAVAAVAQWDWCSVAVFTCATGCGGGGSGATGSGSGEASGGDGGGGGGACFAVEEQVAVVNESELHTLPAGAAGPPPELAL
ncbi:MAG: programmed cell death protein 2 [Monoraphidium minutum]|nr:MAG: programmed cell death protein 2 [Monoraphidium minutum]